MKQKTVLITGGARGIGRAIALELAAEQYQIVINYLHSSLEAEELQNEISSRYGVSCMAIQADVSSEDEVEQMFSEIDQKFGGTDVLINNAAVDLSNLFHLKTAEEFRRTMDVNVIGAFLCAKRAALHMKEAGWGRILNISSTNGMNTYYPMCIDYDASKAALNSLTHDLAMQYAPEIHSELDGYDAEFLKEETDKILVKRYGKPEEVAHLVKFLISDQADYINNTIIRIDGGQAGSI